MVEISLRDLTAPEYGLGQISASSFAIFLGKDNGAFEMAYFVGEGPSPSDILVENLHGQAPSARPAGYRRSRLHRRRHRPHQHHPLKRVAQRKATHTAAPPSDQSCSPATREDSSPPSSPPPAPPPSPKTSPRPASSP